MVQKATASGIKAKGASYEETQRRIGISHLDQEEPPKCFSAALRVLTSNACAA